MGHYPLFLEMADKAALVVGGGAVAERKVRSLLQYGASIRIVSRDLTDGLKDLLETGRISFAGETFVENHLEGLTLVFAATDDRQLNHEISIKARERGVLVNAVDQPEDCTFIVPSIVRRGDLTIAVSTSGKSPALAKRVRKQLESQFGKEYAIFLDFLGRLRGRVISLGLSSEENSRIFNGVVNSDVLKLLAENRPAEAAGVLAGILPEDLVIEDILSDFKNIWGE
ncbi:MAG: bifunctional precorrin-2 dehydrogenase/sirohydrochlorin ferrochelatase [Deltaproteobacteria bacterium]|nr:MAG: bifunctional precorrin-2 dehydrogenase/sirohydrochlorin ferrochelatase [Deltaproteobacteria bacterium]